MNKLYNGDCLEVMATLADGSVDAIITDPPYGTTDCQWDSVIPFAPMWEQLKRIIKPKGAIVMMASQPFTSALVMSNVEMFAYEWIWVKSKITNVLNAKRMPVRKHEQILVFCDRKSTGVYNAQGLVRAETHRHDKVKHSSENYGKRGGVDYVQEFTYWPHDVLEVASEGKTVHPTQKPIALMEYLIKTYTNKGELVLDFTMGSGTTIIAAENTGRNSIGIERDRAIFESAVKRINAHTLVDAVAGEAVAAQMALFGGGYVEQ